MYGDRGDDVVRGHGGRDFIRVKGPRSFGYGGPGADVLEATGGAHGDGQRGSDTLVPLRRSTLVGGLGRDRLQLTHLWRGVRADLSTGLVTVGVHEVRVSGVEDVVGSDHDDVIRGDSGANLIDGAWGDDRIFGREGDDTLLGSFGTDVVDGDDGADLCAGETVTECESEVADSP